MIRLTDIFGGWRPSKRVRPMPQPIEPQPLPVQPLPVPREERAIRQVARPVALPLGAPQRALIDHRDMDPGVDWRANEWRPIAVFKIPQGTIYRIPDGEPVRLYLKARADGSDVDNSGGGSAQDTTISAPGIVKTKMRAVTLPSASHPEVVAWARVNGGDSQKVPVKAIDYAAETVTLSVPAGENWTDIRVYYVHGDGEFRIRAQRELGNADSAAALLMDGAFGAIHTVSQIDDEEAPTWPRKVTLIETNRLVLEVRTSRRVDWTEEAEHMFQIKAYVLHVKVHDKAALRRLAEIDWRGGL